MFLAWDHFFAMNSLARVVMVLDPLVREHF
jgi:hypothetical protein